MNVAHGAPSSPKRSRGQWHGGRMRVARLVLSSVLILASSSRLISQQSTATPQRDPQALAVLKQTVTAMGSSVPGHSAATGEYSITAWYEAEVCTVKSRN